MAVAHGDGFEQRARQLIALPGLSLLPCGSRVQQVHLEPLEDVRASVRSDIAEPADLQLERRQALVELGPLDLAHLIQVGEPTPLALQPPALGISSCRLGLGSMVGGEYALLRVVWQAEYPQVGAELLLDHARRDALFSAPVLLPAAPASEALGAFEVHGLAAPAAADQAGERKDA